MVEPQIVVLVVAGSSPVGHPILLPILDCRLKICRAKIDNRLTNRKSASGNRQFLVSVAQPDRASDFGSEGWGFESLQARHFFGPCRRYVALILISRHAQDRARLLFTHGLTEDIAHKVIDDFCARSPSSTSQRVIAAPI